MIELLGERALSQRPLQNAVAQARFQLPEQCENIGERNRSARFNPLLEVRKGAHEVRDVQNIPFFTVEETAKLLRVKRRTLDNLRWKTEGPPWRRHGGRIVYHRDEVLVWSEQRRAPIAIERTPRRPNGCAPGADE